MPTLTPTELATRLATRLAEDLALEATAFKHLSDRDRKAVEYRVEIFMKLMGDARGDDHDNLTIALSNFASRFLPPLVAACEWFGGGGCYGAVLLLVVQTPYFAKYIQANGAWFYANYVERLIQVNVESDDIASTAVLQCLQILSHLMMYALIFRRVRKISKRTRHEVERWMLCAKNHSKRAVQARSMFERAIYLASPKIDEDIIYLTDLQVVLYPALGLVIDLFSA
ncbi:hypothetical protein B0H13DRAFT_2323836 [Mycena leptocephala]|nr:hypothetical protein B0H13DRAFT_2323836 [Mycena leptocephala]